ncbi:MAG: hypothetical protein ACHBMF_06500 [Chromatiales bacterium]
MAKLTTIKDKLDIFPFANNAVVLGALIGLSYIGIALTRVSPQTSHRLCILPPNMDHPALGHRIRGRWRVVHQNAEARAGGLYQSAQGGRPVFLDQGPAD